MATNTEATLRVSDFRGINRFAEGTVTPPNEFYTLQNMHPPSRGQLKSLKGVLDMLPTALPGVDQIVHANFIDQTFTDGDKKLAVFFRPNISSIPAPVVTAANLSTSGGAGQANGVYITYVGPGGVFKRTLIPAYSIEANGLTVTLPVGIDAPPDYVAEIHVHARGPTMSGLGIPLANAMWLGSFQRRNGVFAPSATFFSPTGYRTPAINSDEITCSPIRFEVEAISSPSGTLKGGTTYYFGLCPWVIDADVDKSLVPGNGAAVTTRVDVTINQATAPLCAYVLPEGFNAVKVTFTGMPAAINLGSPNADYFVLFMGQTPEDLVAVESNGVTGVIKPISRANIENGITIIEHPYNTSLHLLMHRFNNVTGGNQAVTADPNGNDSLISGFQAGAVSTRNFGIFRSILLVPTTDFIEGDLELDQMPFNSSLDNTILGCWIIPEEAITADTIDPTKCWQALPEIAGQYPINYRPNVFDDLFLAAKTVGWGVFLCPEDLTASLYSRSYSNRLFVVNGINTPLYTNGYVAKYISRTFIDSTDPGPRVPITKFIEVFKDRVVLAGGPTTRSEIAANSDGQVFYSETGLPFKYGSPALNSLNANNAETSDISALGVYSPDLSTTGPTTFLVIGKERSVLVWSGDSATGAQLVDRVAGVVGGGAIARTNLGTIFIGRDDVYLLQSGQQIVPFGDEVEQIIKSINPEDLSKTNILFHDKIAKIAYVDPDNGSQYPDREIWLELRVEGGGIQKFYSGPHVLTSMRGQAAALDYLGANDYRLSFLGGKLYRRDVGNTDLGADIPHKIVVNRLDLKDAHFWKVLTRAYLAVGIAQNEDFAFTFDAEDGSAQYTQTLSALLANGPKNLAQMQLAQRFLARISSVTIENSSDAEVSLFDISLLFQTHRRRQLR